MPQPNNGGKQGQGQLTVSHYTGGASPWVPARRLPWFHVRGATPVQLFFLTTLASVLPATEAAHGGPPRPGESVLAQRPDQRDLPSEKKAPVEKDEDAEAPPLVGPEV